VTPSNLLEYRRSHEFQGPSCFCASLSSDESAYTEASIFLARLGPSTGSYVAACATGQCKYWGRFLYSKCLRRYLTFLNPVSIEHLYHQRGLLLRHYPPRRNILTPPPPTPKAQSEKARKLQEVETNIGSTIDLVTQGQQTSGMWSFRSCTLRSIMLMITQPYQTLSLVCVRSLLSVSQLLIQNYSTHSG
jgi:hypothetical protein